MMHFQPRLAPALLAPILSLSALAVARLYPVRRLVILRQVHPPRRLAWWFADEPPGKDKSGKE